MTVKFRLTTPGGAKRQLLRLGVIAICTYIATCLGIAAFQRSLIYFPHKPYDATPREFGIAYEDVQLITEDGIRISAWWVPSATPKPTTDNDTTFKSNPPSSPLGKGGGGADDLANPIFIFFHGNAGNISHRIDKLMDLRQRGISTLIVDYRGYGKSEGTPTETGLYRDADAAWKYLTETKQISLNRIVLFGESLGGAVAIDLAARKNPAALVVECTFNHLADVGHVHYPLVPVSWFLIDRFDSVSRIPRVKCPKLILHSSEDRLVPIRLARQLFDAAAPPKLFIITPGDHNGAGFSYGPQYGDAMMAFLRDNIHE
ncbi:MAG: alpha/beta hydrolase [Planctomycetes bacterium]|nr:alpha/beta hydrolase [Planctomycetota bacterium]